jgi:hypothetical protein
MSSAYRALIPLVTRIESNRALPPPTVAVVQFAQRFAHGYLYTYELPLFVVRGFALRSYRF